MSASAVRIREFRLPSDYEAVSRLWGSIERGVRIGRSDTLPEVEKKLARDPDLFLVAESAGGIIGSVIGGFDGRRGLIYHLAVESSFRGMGIGSRLMNEVEARLHAKGCLKCYLLVTNDNPGRRRILSTARLAAYGYGSFVRKRIGMTIRFGILTLSDRSARGERADLSGPALGKSDPNGRLAVGQRGAAPGRGNCNPRNPGKLG